MNLGKISATYSSSKQSKIKYLKFLQNIKQVDDKVVENLPKVKKVNSDNTEVCSMTEEANEFFGLFPPLKMLNI